MSNETKNQKLASILARVKSISAGIAALTAERKVLNDNFSKLAMIPGRAAKLDAFNVLSLASDEIDLRYSVQLKELQEVVDAIDELQSTYGVDPMLTDVRNFYADKIL